MAVVIRLRGIGLAELQILILSALHARQGAVAVVRFGWYSHKFWIEGANAFGGPARYLEFDIGNAECDAPEARGIWFIAAQAIAPGTCRLDVVVVLAERERGAAKLLCDRREPIEQGLTARNDNAGMAPQHLRVSARQMKLAAADIDPHVAVGHHQIGVAGKPEARDIEQRGQALIRHLDVDVFEMDRVAEVFGGAVEWLLHGCGSRMGFGGIIVKRAA